MKHRDDLHRLATHSIDDSVGTQNEFADLGLSELGDDTPRFWEAGDTLDSAQDSLNDKSSVVRRVKLDSSVNPLQIVGGTKRPPDFHYAENRLLTSSWLTLWPASS